VAKFERAKRFVKGLCAWLRIIALLAAICGNGAPSPLLLLPLPLVLALMV